MTASIDNERERRVYYQEIVYAVCAILDDHYGRETHGLNADAIEYEVKSMSGLIKQLKAQQAFLWANKRSDEGQLIEIMKLCGCDRLPDGINSVAELVKQSLERGD